MGRYDLMESGKKNSIPGGLEQRDADSDGEQKRPHQPPPGCLRSGPVRAAASSVRGHYLSLHTITAKLHLTLSASPPP